MINWDQLVVKEARKILLFVVLATIVLMALHVVLGLFGVLFCMFTVYFFRNPVRMAPEGENLVIAPADGKVIFIGTALEPNFTKSSLQRVTIFMSPFDVHINRSPVTGVVDGVHYQKGKFMAAFDERASAENEQSAMSVRMSSGAQVVFVQIAGWFARRIVSFPKIGDRILRGQIFGLIRFGSRMDVYLPDGAALQVVMGQRVRAGESILAVL